MSHKSWKEAATRAKVFCCSKRCSGSQSRSKMIRPKTEQQAGLQSGTGLRDPNAPRAPQMAEPSCLCIYIQVLGNWQCQEENIWGNVCILAEGITLSAQPRMISTAQSLRGALTKVRVFSWWHFQMQAQHSHTLDILQRLCPPAKPAAAGRAHKPQLVIA